MPDLNTLKRQVVHTVQRFVANPVGRRMPVTMLETTGRKSGEPRRTAAAARLTERQLRTVSQRVAQTPSALLIAPRTGAGLADLRGIASGRTWPTQLHSSGPRNTPSPNR